MADKWKPPFMPRTGQHDYAGISPPTFDQAIADLRTQYENDQITIDVYERELGCLLQFREEQHGDQSPALKP